MILSKIEKKPASGNGKRIRRSIERVISKREKSISKKSDQIIGKIEGHSDGFAFFIPEDKKLEDLFIHPKNLNGAIHGDRVSVTAGMYRGRKEAVVIKILERGMKTFIGVADIVRRKFEVIPLSKSFTMAMKVTEDNFDCDDGDVIVCNISRYPEGNKFGEASVLERVGHINDIGIDNKIVMYKYGLSRGFPDEVSAEAEKIESTAIIGKEKGLTDFRNLFSVTIDGESARDYDDAISVTEEKGKIVLYVHIADVSRFVKKGSAIDEEAKRRGTSVYFPQYAMPMLPEALSNGQCSLLPNEDRYTVTAKIVFSEKGQRVETSFYRSVIKSKHRLTYSYVNRVLAGEEKAYSEELGEVIKLAERLSVVLAGRRADIGGIDFDLPEAEFSFDAEGRVADICPAERGPAERMIEFFMISANEAVADFFNEKNIPAIYRTHGDPDTRKLDEWIETARNFGVELPPIEYPITPMGIRELGVRAVNSRYSSILSSLLVRCMMRAEYTVANAGHFGLASEAYTHFTSPIRRYPDLMVHRALLAALGLGRDKETEEELALLAPEVSRLERLADDAENEISAFKKIEYLNTHEGEIFDAYINRVSSAGFFIFVEKIMMTGFIDFASINFDTFYVGEDGREAIGHRTNQRYRVGDKIKVTLFSSTVILLRADFCLAEEKGRKKKRRG